MSGASQAAHTSRGVLLQALEGLSDREAVRQLETNIGWKAATGLALTDEALFHSTVLVLWRGKLRRSERPQRIFDDDHARQPRLLSSLLASGATRGVTVGARCWVARTPREPGNSRVAAPCCPRTERCRGRAPTVHRRTSGASVLASSLAVAHCAIGQRLPSPRSSACAHCSSAPRSGSYSEIARGLSRTGACRFRDRRRVRAERQWHRHVAASSPVVHCPAR